MRKADNLPLSCAVVMKSGNLNFLEPSGPLQAYNGTDLPFTLFLALLLNGKFDYKHSCTPRVICHSPNHVIEKEKSGAMRDSCKLRFSTETTQQCK